MHICVKFLDGVSCHLSRVSLSRCKSITRNTWPQSKLCGQVQLAGYNTARNTIQEYLDLRLGCVLKNCDWNLIFLFFSIRNSHGIRLCGVLGGGRCNFHLGYYLFGLNKDNSNTQSNTHFDSKNWNEITFWNEVWCRTAQNLRRTSMQTRLETANHVWLCACLRAS